MSKVCELHDGINHRAMLELNQELFYSKVIIHEGYLKVAAAALFEHCTEDLIKDMILEVAKVADDSTFAYLFRSISTSARTTPRTGFFSLCHSGRPFL
jgi:hypothetical protein